MALDGMYIHLLLNEINIELKGARVEKIYQPQKNELLITFRTREKRKRLLIGIAGAAPGFRLTERPADNPQNPPVFTMLLRKYIGSGIFEEAFQFGLDRAVCFRFDAVNELGDRVKLNLVTELLPGNANIILLDSEMTVTDALKRVYNNKPDGRKIVPGEKYEAIKGRGKTNILASPVSEISDAVLRQGDITMQRALLNVLEGASPLTCKELLARSGCLDKTPLELTDMNIKRLAFELDVLKSSLKTNLSRPCIVKDENGNYSDFSFMILTSLKNGETIEEFDSLSGALDEFCYNKERYLRTKAKAQDLFKSVKNLIAKNSRKLDNRRLDLEKCAGMDEKKFFGELINTDLPNLKKGSSSYRVRNWYDGGKTVVIPVKPELTPTENANRYFKEYRKLKNSEALLKDLIKKSKADLYYLESVYDELERAESDTEINEIRQELHEAGFLKTPSKAFRKNAKKLSPRRFISPSGHDVFVGRNNYQNDRLSLHDAHGGDIWFHAKNIPGSHVVLSSDGAEIQKEDIEFAAGVAAWFSSARNSGKAEVDYTRVKELKKPAGAKPGFVVYKNHSSIKAKPTEPTEENGEDR